MLSDEVLKYETSRSEVKKESCGVEEGAGDAGAGDGGAGDGGAEQQPLSSWQVRGGLTAAALRAVFAWLRGRELARAGAACRAWRAAAAEPALWRRLLLPLTPHLHDHRTALAHLYESGAWRGEWVRAHAGWAARGRLRAAAPLAHAALSPCAARLALATDDAHVLIWERMDETGESWQESGGRNMRASGWASVARVDWAPAPPAADATAGGSARLLLAGPLAVGNRWELVVLQEQESGCESEGEGASKAGSEGRCGGETRWSVAARAGCSAGAAGCWAGAGAFLALELRRLAPFQYATTVWLNAATQEAQSEYAGVTTPLLRVYNEDAATITHVAVAEAPLVAEGAADLAPGDGATLQTLVAGFSGGAGAVRAWGLRALRPPPLLAGADLRARASARRAARAAPAPPVPEPEPDEHAVRALCTPHDYECRLPAALEGLYVQQDGRCVWACMSGGRVRCASLPALRALRDLPPPRDQPAPQDLYLRYVQPALSHHYFVTPLGGHVGAACAWTRASGAALAPLPLPAPALAAALPAPRVLLVLAADTVYARLQPSNMALRVSLAALPRALPMGARALASQSCSGSAAPACPPCEPAPRPPCRAQPAARARALRRVCCPPPQGRPPPCPPPPCSRPLACSNPGRTKKRVIPVESINCGADRDAVALRLALAERARRLDYEREVKARPAQAGLRPPLPEPFALGRERECARATDGRSYALACTPQPTPPCGPGRAPPPERCVEIIRDNECTIRDGDHVDPCAHVPRTLLEIDRSNGLKAVKSAAPARNFASRIMNSLSLTRASDTSNSCPKRPSDPKCDTTGAKKAGDFGWCQSLPPPNQVAPPCQQPTPLEKLKRRGPGRCGGKNGTAGKRNFHSSVANLSAASHIDSKIGKPEVSSQSGSEANALKKVLQEREKFNPAGRGRVVTGGEKCGMSRKTTAGGSLDIAVPSGAQSVRVRVSLDSEKKQQSIDCVCVDHCKSKVPDNSKKQESWLSIKSIQKKLAGCRKMDTAKMPQELKKDSDTCPRSPPKAPKPSETTSPCALPKEPTQPSPCVPPKSPLNKPPKKSDDSPCQPFKQPKHSPCKIPKNSNSKNSACNSGDKIDKFSFSSHRNAEISDDITFTL